MTIEFFGWPKIARLNRNMIITEKIDGTNAAIGIVELPNFNIADWLGSDYTELINISGGTWLGVYAQSRKRIIKPSADNFGFAQWVGEHCEELVDALGVGLHFGEWWGSGIQRGYALSKGERHFSLFNTSRYADADFSAVDGLGVVPVLYEGLFDTAAIDDVMELLEAEGSHASPGFLKPEGVVIYLSAARTSFKVTFDNDAAPKGAAGHALDEEAAA